MAMALDRTTDTTKHRSGTPPAINTRGDSITILLAASGHASKQIVRCEDGSIEIGGFTAGKWFAYIKRDITDINSLSQILEAVAAIPNGLVIRGSPRSGLEGDKRHRRLKANFQTPVAGDHWILIDFDKTPLPPGLLLTHDVGNVCEHLVSLLPPEFHDVSYHWQLSSSAGFTDPSVVSMHLWFWLDRPVPDAALKEWAKDWNARAGLKIIDPALFNDVQAHYTAAPAFVGVADPFPVRSGLTTKAVGAVAIKLPTRAAEPVGSNKGASAYGVRASGGFETILGQIGDHAGGEGFHEPIIRAVASYVATNEVAKIDAEALFETVRARVLVADRSRHDDRYVESMASREHITPAITTAITKYGKADSPRRKSRQIQGIAPHFGGKTTTVAEAYSQLEGTIGRFFRLRPCL